MTYIAADCPILYPMQHQSSEKGLPLFIRLTHVLPHITTEEYLAALNFYAKRFLTGHKPRLCEHISKISDTKKSL